MLNHPLVAHFDGDSFFVSCEILRRPELRGLPVVTGGERGVVTSMSIEAKRLGVRRCTPCFQVREVFPTVVIVSSDIEYYRSLARRVYRIVRKHANLVEEYSIDECFALVDDVEVARIAKADLESSTGLSFGVGVSITKTLAKVASRFAKPGGFVSLFDQGERESALAKLPVDAVWGIGPRGAAYFRARGIATALELSRLDDGLVRTETSSSTSRTIRELRGSFELPLVEDAPARFFERYSTTASAQASFTSSRSFHPPTRSIDEVYARAVSHLDEACARARASGLAARRISVFLRDSTYRYRIGDAKIDVPSASPIGCAPALRRALIEAIRPGDAYRTVGVALHDMAERGVAQETLFDTEAAEARRAKAESVADAVDAVRHRFGDGSVQFGSFGVVRQIERKGTAVCGTPVRPWSLPHLGEVR